MNKQKKTPTSLRDLGGDGRKIDLREAMPALHLDDEAYKQFCRQIDHILSSTPKVAAEIAVNMQSEYRNALAYLIAKNGLTEAQFDLIALEIPNVVQPNTELQTEMIHAILNNTSEGFRTSFTAALKGSGVVIRPNDNGHLGTQLDKYA